MKDILIDIIIAALLIITGFVLARNTYTQPEPAVVDTVYITDTIYNPAWDTVFIKDFDTVQLPVIVKDFDTITTVKIDSIYVQVPIYNYEFDTTIIGQDYETYLKAVLSGFNVSMEQLSIGTKIMHQEANLTPSHWWNNIGFGVGIGLGYKDGFFVTPTVGVMYRLK